jgi:carboxypeptidase C (cathepsin A)
VSNLLFIESPAGVGYSLNKNDTFEYNDLTTANDNFAALLNFFENYAEYGQNDFWIAGESYAGKYIPDLAVLIDAHNNKENVTKINLKGLLIGNGVMSF